MRLRQLRKQHGYTQSQLASLLGVDRTTYNKYERGQSEPSLDTLRALARHYGVTIDYLVCESDTPTAHTPIESFTAILDDSLDIAALTDDQKKQLRDFAAYLASQSDPD